MAWRRRPHEDFSAELQAHLEHETDRLVAEGMAPDQARSAAIRSFGNVVAAKERYYEAARWMWLDQLAQDLRYGWRGLRHSKAFFATTVLTLAVGLGLTTVAFTIFNAYVLRPFAVRNPSNLYRIAWRSHDAGGQSFTWRDYEDLRDRRDLFDAVIADDTRFVSSNGRPLSAAFVSDNYFEALGPRVLLGRALAGVDSRSPVAVLSHQAWTRLFARDPAVLGREIDIDGQPFAIIGVLRPEFSSLDDSPRDLWAPFSAYADSRPALLGPNQPRHAELSVRLRSDVSVDHAQSALTPFMTRMVEKKDEARELRAEVQPQSTPNPLSVELLAVLSPVFAAFGLVLVTACANVSNVMLARSIARHREIAVRLSIGASRGRVVRQLLTEGLLMAVLAGAAGLALAAWALRAGMVALFSTLPPSFAALLRVAPLDFDYRVFLFALAVAAMTTLMFALLPALQASRLPLTDALRGQRTGTRRGSRLRSALVIGQVAVSLVLVIATLTLARNGTAVGAIDLGYQTHGVVSINVRGEGEAPLVRKLAQVLADDPRVAELAVTGGNPLFERSRAVAAAPAGAGRSAVGTRYTFVSPEYFAILRVPIARGRGFRPDEGRTAAGVAIVSDATARAFWPGDDPIGKTIRIERPGGRPVDELPGYSQVIVVGTTRDVVSGMMIDGQDAGHIYLPTSATDPHAVALLLRARADRDLGPAALQGIFERVAQESVFEAVPLDEIKAVQMYPLRAASWIGAVLGGIALVLSVSGLYGVLTYTLSQRTKEIGIRMALGATAGAVMRLVMRQSARLAGVGALIGLVVAFAAMEVLSSVIRFRNVTVVDATAFTVGLVAVLTAATIAAYHPARHATRVDPSETLRAEA
jgi:predicted permease